MCQSAGGASGVTFDATTKKWNWTCSGSAGGADDSCSAPFGEVDIKLRIFQDDVVKRIAGEVTPDGVIRSPLRVRSTNGTVYGVLIVDSGFSKATKVKVKTPNDGVKYLKEMF